MKFTEKIFLNVPLAVEYRQATIRCHFKSLTFSKKAVFVMASTAKPDFCDDHHCGARRVDLFS